MIPDLLARLRLVRTAGIGPVLYSQLLMRFDAALAALPIKGLRPPKALFSPRAVYEEAPSPVETEADLRSRIFQLLGLIPAPVDDFVCLSRASAREVQLVLLELDLGVRLDRNAGGKVSVSPA